MASTMQSVKTLFEASSASCVSFMPMNAIDTDGNPIPGLNVIGNDSGGFFANTYPNLATGVACGRTVTFGRLVGKHLAKA